MKGRVLPALPVALKRAGRRPAIIFSTQPPKAACALTSLLRSPRAVIIPALGDFRTDTRMTRIVLGTADRKIDLIAERVDCVIRLGELNDSSFVAGRSPGTAAMSCG